MDMSQYANPPSYSDMKLRGHCKGIRDNQVSVALMILYLAGYEVELKDVGVPNASAAREALDELGMEGIPIWSCSTKDGGIWERWQRDALKYGELTDAYDIWKRRMGF